MNAREQRSGLPLDGIRVVEFTHMVMGPTCGMILADLGAEVIKVEPPGGDKTRTLPGLGIGFFRSFNRNKKSVVVDIRSDAGRATAKELIATADVVLENFRPGLRRSASTTRRSRPMSRASSTSRTRASCPARTNTAPRSTKSCR
jgi:crotonobetainyl-CoA:carnitine CoA-transferase CaiB-like acyl-CoA transferase